MKNKIQFLATAIQWRDRINGNLYSSVRIQRVDTGETIACGPDNGGGEYYRQMGRERMLTAGWLPEQYVPATAHLYESEHDYPIAWTVSKGTKTECWKHGTL
jgi:hypothetical protein